MLQFVLVFATLLSASPVGEIFGDLRLGEKYLSNVPLQLKCGDETVDTKTDDAGSFRLRVKTNGECKLTVSYSGQRPSLNVVVFEKPTRYRFVLEEKGGKFVLKRS
jgi:hypothetical protein